MRGQGRADCDHLSLSHRSAPERCRIPAKRRLGCNSRKNDKPTKFCTLKSAKPSRFTHQLAVRSCPGGRSSFPGAGAFFRGGGSELPFVSSSERNVYLPVAGFCSAIYHKCTPWNWESQGASRGLMKVKHFAPLGTLPAAPSTRFPLAVRRKKRIEFAPASDDPRPAQQHRLGRIMTSIAPAQPLPPASPASMR
jgi:hypothetical protein